MLLCVIYLRVSTEEQARKGYSLPEQREACRRKAEQLAAGQDLTIAEFVDDFGGDVAERPVLEQVRDYVRAHRPAWFICMDPDRFSRSLKLQLIVADDLEAQGTRLAFVQQEYDPTDLMSRAFFQFRGLMSELDKAKILERTTRGKRGKLKAGRRPNGAAPYGYRHRKETDQLEIYEPEAQWVRRIFAWVAHEQAAVHTVTRRLNDLGVPRKRNGSLWHRSVVAGLLRNPAYCGEMRCNRQDFRGIGAVRRLPREKRRALSARLRPPGEWITVPVPPIISRELWQLAQANLTTVPRRTDRGLLSTLLRCGACGGSMSYAGRYIRCQRRYGRRAAEPLCANPHHRSDRVEAAVWGSVVAALCNHGAFVHDLPDVRGPLLEERRALEARLESERRVQVLTVRKRAEGALTDSVADELLRESDRIARSVQAELESLERRLAADPGRPAPAVRPLLETLDPGRRRQLALLVLDRVTVGPDGSVVITWRH
ncbi:MAG TPA: recombinase family protein [Symbiobacteriaceae bacterium]|nr:recombinase family protein [Symbiobacteriaceae bacterium]